MKTTVYFGSDQQMQQRNFKTRAEFDAYLKGVDDSIGWSEYRISQKTADQCSVKLHECYDVKENL